MRDAFHMLSITQLNKYITHNAETRIAEKLDTKSIAKL